MQNKPLYTSNVKRRPAENAERLFFSIHPYTESLYPYVFISLRFLYPYVFISLYLYVLMSFISPAILSPYAFTSGTFPLFPVITVIQHKMIFLEI